MQLLRANTAVDVLIGPFVEDGDGDSPLTGLSLDVELSKNGQALADSESAAPTHDSAGTVDGYYNCILGTTDTNTEGQLVLVVHHADALPIRHEYMVMAEAAWDSMFVAKDAGFMDVNIKSVGRADAQETEANNLESACSNYSVTRGLTGTALPAAAAAAAGGLPLSTAGALEMDTLADWINGGRLDLILDIIASDTTTDIPALIATAQADLDILTGADGANLLSATQASIDAIAGYLDTEIAAIVAAVITNAAGADVAADIIALKAVVDALNNISVADITGAEVDNDGTAISLAGALKLILAIEAGKSSGGGTATIVFRDIANTKNRISATVDASGNRTAIGTRDAT